MSAAICRRSSCLLRLRAVNPDKWQRQGWRKSSLRTIQRTNLEIAARFGILLFLGIPGAFVGATLDACPYVDRDAQPLYRSFNDDSFPFLESTLDLRGIAPKGNDDNLAPRATIFKLPEDCYVAFDTELLRVIAVWQGNFLKLRGIAMLSYADPLTKEGKGISQLPAPRGKVFAATGRYPGWQPTRQLSTADPRDLWIDERELGRGPLDPAVRYATACVSSDS